MEYTATVRAFFKNGKLRSMDVFKSTSERGAEMSSNYGQGNGLESYIGANDNSGIVGCLEKMVLENTANDGEKLLLGVLLLLPPFADYASAIEVLDNLLDGPRALDAATWIAYGYGTLQPNGSRNFEAVLKLHPTSAAARHMLGLVALADNDQEKFLSENRASRRIRLFPFNILSALDGDDELAAVEKGRLRRVLVDLLISRNAESDTSVRTVEGLLSRKWDNLISGVRVTSQYWEVLATSHDLV